MESRPKIKLTLNRCDKTLELIGDALLVFLWAITLYTFMKSPVSIPIHFNASGQADKYGNKGTVFILAISSTIIYFVLIQLNKYPHVFNYITKITKDNAQMQYAAATRMLRFLKVAVLLIFIIIILFTYLIMAGVLKGLSVYFLPLSIGLLFVPTLILLLRSQRKKAN